MLIPSTAFSADSVIRHVACLLSFLLSHQFSILNFNSVFMPVLISSISLKAISFVAKAAELAVELNISLNEVLATALARSAQSPKS